MHTPESKRNANLRDLGLEFDQFDAFADLPVIDLDLPVADLDLPFEDLVVPEPVAEVSDAAKAPAAAPSTSTSTSASASASSGKSVRISIRVPRGMLEDFKARATGSEGYQTLMVRALRQWLVCASRTGAGA
ncbi:BrnA antitoxin family protein [Ramlibacter sp. XY19]|uniref:BrnA antitoxin family protein n=1 Tax=Ramlibacter paludis TaxID=2908000 RepID=UPI0023DB8644|nr:BrnA antitoxin family protein [Ramlibacter paludis]MCG2592140.1 BrnA antitoxin family protein [Ramlibacter paludis]